MALSVGYEKVWHSDCLRQRRLLVHSLLAIGFHPWISDKCHCHLDSIDLAEFVKMSIQLVSVSIEPCPLDIDAEPSLTFSFPLVL